jgi:hypothetical protein
MCLSAGGVFGLLALPFVVRAGVKEFTRQVFVAQLLRPPDTAIPGGVLGRALHMFQYGPRELAEGPSLCRRRRGSDRRGRRRFGMVPGRRAGPFLGNHMDGHRGLPACILYLLQPVRSLPGSQHICPRGNGDIAACAGAVSSFASVGGCGRGYAGKYPYPRCFASRRDKLREKRGTRLWSDCSKERARTRMSIRFAVDFEHCWQPIATLRCDPPPARRSLRRVPVPRHPWQPTIRQRPAGASIPARPSSLASRARAVPVRGAWQWTQKPSVLLDGNRLLVPCGV